MSDVERALAELVARGLLMRNESAGGTAFSFDDAVAAKIAAWMDAHPAERAGVSEDRITSALGEWYAASFEALADAGTLEAMDEAADVARHALQSFLRAQAFGDLGAFAARLVTGTRDPELLGQVIDDLTASGVDVVFSDYRIRRLIGVGTTSAVYEAERIDNALPVAVKVLAGRWPDDEADVFRFLDDAKLANRVRHPNVVEVFDAGHTEGTRFLVTELLRGRSLERRWRAKGRRLPLKRVLSVTMHVLGVLAAAHEKSILHGGIKPSNVFITSEGVVRVLDFGIESLTRAASPPPRFRDEREPPSFLAPEQIRGELPDPRTDLFSVGSTMLALLSGRPADPGGGAANRAMFRGLPRAVVEVIERAIDPSRDERWQSAQEMWEAIAEIHADLADPGEHISDPGSGSAPLVETQPAGPLSERVELEGGGAAPLRSMRPPLHKPAAGEPAEAYPAPVPDDGASARWPSARPPPALPVVPIPLIEPETGVPPRERSVVHDATKYLVPIGRAGARYSPLILIALPVLVMATLITVLWLSLRDRNGASLTRRDNDTDAAGGVGPIMPDPTCRDGVRNNAETDVDCGGGRCPPCGALAGCVAATDCRTGVCSGGACVTCAKASDCARGTVCRAGACVRGEAGVDGGAAVPGSDGGPLTSPVDAGRPLSSDDAGPRAPEDSGVAGGAKKNGEACGSAGECTSGFCTDGVCCNNACTGTCVACNLRSFRGMCAEVPYGYDPDRECAPKVCDGDGACGDRKINGKRCKAGRECKSGNCWRGVCCNTECRGADGNCSTGKCQRSLLIE